MSRTLTASDRKTLIRLASTMPKGSEERRAILAGLRRVAAKPDRNLKLLPQQVKKIQSEIKDQEVQYAAAAVETFLMLCEDYLDDAGNPTAKDVRFVRNQVTKERGSDGAPDWGAAASAAKDLSMAVKDMAPYTPRDYVMERGGMYRALGALVAALIPGSDVPNMIAYKASSFR